MTGGRISHDCEAWLRFRISAGQDMRIAGSAPESTNFLGMITLPEFFDLQDYQNIHRIITVRILCFMVL